MSVLAQHGFRKGQKLQLGLKEGAIAGVVFSPRDEEPNDLLQLASSIRDDFADAILLMDPQVYASTVQTPRDRHLPEYPFYTGELRRAAFTTRFIAKTVKSCLDFQNPVPLTYLVSPSIAFATPDDGWSQIAFQFAEESIEQHGGLKSKRPLLVSLVLDESALTSRASLDDLLDSLTTLDCAGFYICLIRGAGTQYGPAMSTERLANLLYMAYALATANDYEVIAGYADWIGLLLHSVGVKHCTTGWGLGLRQLQWSRFEQGGFGRQPKERYSSIPLLNSVFLEELEACWRVKKIANVLSGTSQDKPFTMTNPLNVPWPQELSTLQHWEALSLVSRAITTRAQSNRMAYMRSRIDEARATYDGLISQGIQFSQSTGSGHLQQWSTAIDALTEATS